MGLTITSSSYAGKQAGEYLHAALNGADSLEYATVRDAVNYKEVLNNLTNSNLVKDATCDFDEQSSTLTMTERVLEVEQFQVNQDIQEHPMYHFSNLLTPLSHLVVVCFLLRMVSVF